MCLFCFFRSEFTSDTCSDTSQFYTIAYQMGPCYGYTDYSFYFTATEEIYYNTGNCTGESITYQGQTDCQYQSESDYQTFEAYGTNGAMKAVLNGLSLLATVIVGVSILLF